jgi:chaperonin cofactor prefoldin
MVTKNLLADYGQASVELEFAQERYNQIRAEIVKQIQFDQEQAKLASQKQTLEPPREERQDVIEELKKIDEAIENNK